MMTNSFNITLNSAERSKFSAHNNASNFSFPFEMNVTEGWQMGVTDFYFPHHMLLSNEELYWIHKDLSQDRVLKSKKPTKIFLRSWPTLHDTLVYIRETFKELLHVTWNKTQCSWKVYHENYLIVLSNPLRHAVGLWQDVLTPWDKDATNCVPVDYDQVLPLDQYLIFVPMSYTHETHHLKEKGSVFACDRLIQLMNKHMNVAYDKQTLRLSAPKDSQLYVFSEALHEVFPFNQAGTCANPLRRAWNGKCNVVLDKTWTLFIYSLTDMVTYEDPYDSVGNATFINSMRRPGDSAAFLAMLNYLLKPNDIHVSLRYDNHIIIEMKDLQRKFTLGEQLRHIMGFDETTFITPNTYVSQRPLSAGFHHLYVYCSLVDYANVGHAEEQLLFSIPINDKTLTHPIYVPLQCGNTKQINFTVRNEKGNIVVFPENTSTHLKLHFRQ